MATTYIQHPTGYPLAVYAIQGRARHWWVTRDW